MAESNRKPEQMNSELRDAAAMPQPAVDPATGRIACDLPCIGCDYNLRTLRADGRCPECGKEVAASVREFKTAPTERDWLTTIKLGFDLLVCGSVCLCCMVVALFVIEGLPRVHKPPYGVVAIPGLIGTLLVLVGSFVVMGANLPYSMVQEPRWFGRVFLAGLLGTPTLGLVIANGPKSLAWSWILLAPMAGSMPIAFIAYCRWLAGRRNRDGLRKATTWAIWGMVAWVVVTTLLFASFVPLVLGVGGLGERARGALLAASIIILLLELAFCTPLFLKFRRMIMDELKHIS